MAVAVWSVFQAIGHPPQRDMPGIQSFDEPGGASWGTLTAVRMQWMAATGIGASKIAGRPGLALGGRGLVPGPAFVVRGTSRSDGRVRANQEVSLRIIIKLDVLSHIR